VPNSPSFDSRLARHLVFFVFAASLSIPGAEAQLQVPSTATQSPSATVHTQDGGVRERLVSIKVPPKLGAPFTATLDTEWVRALGDGGTMTLINERKIARDTNGRIYQERWLLVPKNGKLESQMTQTEISDPHEHTMLVCIMDGQKLCHRESYAGNPDAVYDTSGPPAGPLADNRGYVIRDELGTQLLEGLETVGSRVSTTFNPGAMGNDKKMTVTLEVWNAKQLGINLLSKRIDPLNGDQTFTVKNLILSEPDPKIFEVPEGFRVTDD